MCPSDLLIALAYAVVRIAKNTGGKGHVQIVLSSTHDDKTNGPQEGWGDTAHIADLKWRLKKVILGLAYLQPEAAAFFGPLAAKSQKIDLTEEQVGLISAAGQIFGPFDVKSINMDDFDQYFQVKRVMKGDEGNNVHYQHSKIVCIDDRIMYCGSDNAYPSYNEEHGIWIEDEPTIQAWKEKFWNELWENRTFVTDE